MVLPAFTDRALVMPVAALSLCFVGIGCKLSR